jgi:hypothetical protein
MYCVTVSHSLIVRTPSYSGILRSVVKRNTEELPGDHSEDRNAEKKVQLIMSTATLTKVITHLTPSSFPVDPLFTHDSFTDDAEHFQLKCPTYPSLL